MAIDYILSHLLFSPAMNNFFYLIFFLVLFVFFCPSWFFFLNGHIEGNHYISSDFDKKMIYCS